MAATWGVRLAGVWLMMTGLVPFAAGLLAAAGEPTPGDITAAAFGDIHDTSDGGRPMGKGGRFETPPSGDTWYSTWAADDSLYVNVDDGLGFDNPGGKGVMLRNALCLLTGNPNESTDGFRGTNLNPGSRGATIPNSKNEGLHGYTSSIFELDGVLYQVRHAWSPTPQLWPPIDSCIIKSADGGRNWMDHLGRKNAPLGAGPNAMFPALPWSWMNFIQYGRGGAAPAVDGADKYVYLTAGGTHLVRVPRQKLPDLKKADFQYYRGAPADGNLDTSWSAKPDEAGKMDIEGAVGLSAVVYNPVLKRYVGTAGDYYFAPGEGGHDTGKARFIIVSAEHPWGPWKRVLTYGIWGRAGWNMLMANKFGSADGRKMWYVFCGEYKGDVWYYGFQYMPLYLSTGPVDIYEAEAAALTGARAASAYPGASGGSYIENFAQTGDRAVFELKGVSGTGWHIVRIRYTSPKTNGGMMSVYVNGRKARRVKLSLNNSGCKPELNWADRSDIYFLKDGANTFEIRQDAGDSCPGLMIDCVAVSRERTYDEGVNVAAEAKATASSGDAARIPGGCPGDTACEWSATGPNGQWIKLEWAEPKTISLIRLYDKVSARDQVSSGTLSFSDGSTLPVGRLQNDGQAGTVLAFPPKTVSWVKLTIDTVRSGTANAGLGAFEAFSERK